MNNNIAEQLRIAHLQMAEHTTAAGKAAGSVQLIAVSKTRPAADIETAYQYGQRAFGENYPQELAEKASQLITLPQLEWHFIGPLQSNKTRLVAQNASWVHSIDRLKIAERLSAQRPAGLAPLKVLLQINISDEASKSGIAPADMLPLAQQVTQLPGLQLKGLMAIPAPLAEPAAQEHVFSSMQQLSEQLQQHYPQATELSMGMSDDWTIALRYGATMIRLGTAIFGRRNYHRNDSEHE